MSKPRISNAIEKIARNSLDSFQSNILKDCIKKGSGGLSVPMGTGKTRIMLAKIVLNGCKGLVICEISLLREWENEIRRVYGDELKYEIVTPTVLKANGVAVDDWKMDTNTHIVIITPTILAAKYSELDPAYSSTTVVENEVVGRRAFQRKHHTTVSSPFLPQNDDDTGIRTIYTTKWNTLVIDEGTEYYNVSSARFKAMCAIAANNRWVLSGTITPNPKVKYVLGFYCLINHPETPRSQSELVAYMKSIDYGGIKDACVVRETTPILKDLVLHTKIVTHSMFPNEQLVYTTFKKCVVNINSQIQDLRERGIRTDDIKKLSTYLLTVIIYLRQSLLCPLLPIASIAVNVADATAKNELAKMVNNEIKTLGIEEWLNDEQSAFSSRIQAIIKTMDFHPTERIVMFASHRTDVNLLVHFIKDREVFVLKPTMNSTQRNATINDFEETENGVLILTYRIGGKGLNLQHSNVAFIVSFDWAADDSLQAVHRLLRRGQQNDVHVYYFASNTGVESVILKKQLEKKNIAHKMMNGPVVRFLKSTNISRFVDNIINLDDNINVVKEIYIKVDEMDNEVIKGDDLINETDDNELDDTVNDLDDD